MNIIAPRRPKAAISTSEMERRREALRQADASNRIEGIFRSPQTQAVFDSYIRGEIEVTDIVARLKALD